MRKLESYFERTQTCETEDDLFRQFAVFADGYGADVCSYLIVAKRLRAVPFEVGLVWQNFPADWVKDYLDGGFHEFDPILEQARREARPFHWFDVEDKFSLTARQKQFLIDLKATGLTDGIAVPVFGPMGTIAYFGLGCMQGALEMSERQELEIQCACLQTHNRYFELSHINGLPPNKPLSPREKEVLSLVAGGLSNNFIAERLDISENTVDTMLRRVFSKLGVHNRISAVLQGIGSGVILP